MFLADFSLFRIASGTIVRDDCVVEGLLVGRIQAGVFEKLVIAAEISVENYSEGVDWGDIRIQVLRAAVRQVVSIEDLHTVVGRSDHPAMVTL